MSGTVKPKATTTKAKTPGYNFECLGVLAAVVLAVSKISGINKTLG
jgi:hypothetical protein